MNEKMHVFFVRYLSESYKTLRKLNIDKQQLKMAGIHRIDVGYHKKQSIFKARKSQYCSSKTDSIIGRYLVSHSLDIVSSILIAWSLLMEMFKFSY